MVRIGVLDVRGSMPYYEELPFNAHVKDKGIIMNLDALVIPPGSQVESMILERYPWIYNEVWEFIERGGMVIGVCSGLQLLSKAINLNVKGLPGYVNGLGVLDLTVEPLIITGPVVVKIVKETWVTKGLLNAELRGWHAHTYGRLIVGNEDIVGFAITGRFNYINKWLETPSLVISRKYKVFGTMTHGLMGRDSPIIKNILNELDFHGDYSELYRDFYEHDWRDGESNTVSRTNRPRILTIVSTMSGEGKTLIMTAVTYCLSKMGYNVGVAKLGGDVRDLHPSLYILRKPLKQWMSIELTWGNTKLGLMPWSEVINEAPAVDVFVIEGVMGLLTGSSREAGNELVSTLGLVRKTSSSTILIASASLDGMEGAIFRLRAYLNMLRELNVDVKLVIINEAYHGQDEDRLIKVFIDELRNLGINTVIIDRLNIASKPEELMDLGDYEEAAIKIGEEAGLCKALMDSLGLLPKSEPGNR